MATGPINISGAGRKVFLAVVLFLFKKDAHPVFVWLFACSCLALSDESYWWTAGFVFAAVASLCVSASKS